MLSPSRRKIYRREPEQHKLSGVVSGHGLPGTEWGYIRHSVIQPPQWLLGGARKGGAIGIGHSSH